MTVQPVLLKINPAYEALLPKLSKEEFEALKLSIKEEGQHYPIIINPDRTILDGHNRYRICLELGIEPKVETRQFPIELVERKFVIESNLRRRHLNNFQRCEMGMPLLEIERQLAKSRQGERTDLTLTPNGANVGDPHQQRATAKVAKTIGVSRNTFERARTIIESGSEKAKEKARSGKQSINYAYQQIMREENHTNTPNLPKGEFDIIYADPPWQYDYAETDGTADVHYAAKSTKDICELGIPSAEDAVLFLWATTPKLQDALKVMKAWDFEYKTNLVWVKGNGGIGYYFQGNHELLLVGKKGNIPAPMPESRVSSVLQVPKRNHSQKPDEVYDIIERMYPNRKYLELFARNSHANWCSWGNEIGES